MSTTDPKQQSPAVRLLDTLTAGAWSELATLIRGIMGSPDKWKLISSPVLAVLVIGAIAAGQVRLNSWQGALYDALQHYEVDAFVHQLLVFVGIIVGLLCLVVAQAWLTEVSKVRLRAWLTRDLLDAWLRPNRLQLLSFAGEVGVNPDQRIQEDARHWAELSAELGGGFTQSTLLLISFIGVLWLLSEQVIIVIAAKQFTIPGYLVWCAVAYASAGLWLTRRVGKPLAALNAERYSREAEFRAALVRVVQHADAVALYQGEPCEKASLDRTLGELLSVMRALAGGLVRLTWITSGHGWFAIIVPFLMAAPGYFEGKLSFGSLIIIVGAFNQVLGSLRWQVDNFSRIADWRATLSRVVAICQALNTIDSSHELAERISYSDHPDGKLSLEAVETYSPGSPGDRIVVDEKRVEFSAGDHVLVTAETSAATTTFFQALAGLWPWGSGSIRVPPRSAMMFLPQQPYLPPGRLCDAILYPSKNGALEERELQGILKRIGLEHLVKDLGRHETWDKHLSLEEQQALGFARVLLHAPKWVFLDGALAALDPAKRESLMKVFGAELASAAVITMGHASADATFYNKVLNLRQSARAFNRVNPSGSRLD